MKKTIIFLILIIAIMGSFIFYKNRLIKQKALFNNQTNQQANTKFTSKTDGQLAVTVIVTPIDISPQAKEWKFDVVMNNHSIELDQDLVKNTVLIDDQGKEYKPLRWEGAGPGGHHREGTLIFNQITPSPKSIELKISGIKNVVRNFKWNF